MMTILAIGDNAETIKELADNLQAAFPQETSLRLALGYSPCNMPVSIQKKWNLFAKAAYSGEYSKGNRVAA